MYHGNKLFEELCKNDLVAYLAKQNVTNAKKINNIGKIEGILTAYKLFYVGCSRERKNLIVVVDKSKIAEFEKAFISKSEEIGFSIS